MKTLKEAIGCWTSADGKWNDLVGMTELVMQTAKKCRHITNLNNRPEVLLAELGLLQKRVDSLRELTASAVIRCNQIIDTNELKRTK